MTSRLERAVGQMSDHQLQQLTESLVISALMTGETEWPPLTDFVVRTYQQRCRALSVEVLCLCPECVPPPDADPDEDPPFA